MATSHYELRGNWGRKHIGSHAKLNVLRPTIFDNIEFLPSFGEWGRTDDGKTKNAASGFRRTGGREVDWNRQRIHRLSEIQQEVVDRADHYLVVAIWFADYVGRIGLSPLYLSVDLAFASFG